MADPDSDYVPDFNVIDHHRELHVFMGQLNRILNIKTKTDKFAHIRRQAVRIIYFGELIKQIIKYVVTHSREF